MILPINVLHRDFVPNKLSKHSLKSILALFGYYRGHAPTNIFPLSLRGYRSLIRKQYNPTSKYEYTLALFPDIQVKHTAATCQEVKVGLKQEPIPGPELATYQPVICVAETVDPLTNVLLFG